MKIDEVVCLACCDGCGENDYVIVRKKGLKSLVKSSSERGDLRNGLKQ